MYIIGKRHTYLLRPIPRRGYKPNLGVDCGFPGPKIRLGRIHLFGALDELPGDLKREEEAADGQGRGGISMAPGDYSWDANINTHK
jgi:hypothetical protein